MNSSITIKKWTVLTLKWRKFPKELEWLFGKLSKNWQSVLSLTQEMVAKIIWHSKDYFRKFDFESNSLDEETKGYWEKIKDWVTVIANHSSEKVTNESLKADSNYKIKQHKNWIEVTRII